VILTKKQLALIARAVVALAGVAFIVLTLTWQDQVTLPASYELPSGRSLTREATVPVRAMTEQTLVVDVSRFAEAEPARLRLPRAELGPGVNQPQLQPGVTTTIARTDWRLIAFTMLGLALVFPMQAGRWLLLMRCRGMDVPFGRAFRLTMVGLFFNFCMLGQTGGDVVKAYYTAKNSGQRSTAVMSVLFDRLAGLVGLVLLAGLVGLTSLGDPLVGRITLGLWLGLVGLAALTGAYQSAWLRKKLRLDALLNRLPGGEAIAKVDRAAVAYRHHKPTIAATIAISVIVHTCLMTAAALAGKALGVEHALGVMIAVLPVVFLAGALPITYQGFGVMEGLTLALLKTPGLATANQLVGMLLLFRLCMLVFALMGSLVLLRGDVHLFPEQAKQGEKQTGISQQNVHTQITRSVS